MPLTRAQKEHVVAKTQDDLSAATSVVFVAFSGLTVMDVNNLRDKLHESGGAMRVMSKRLLRLVMQNAKLDFDPVIQEGQIAVVWGTDAVTPAKIMHEFAKEHENLRLISGTLEGALLNEEQVLALAQLPSREELLGKVVGVLAGPMRGFVSVLSGVPRAAVYVLKALADKQGE